MMLPQELFAEALWTEWQYSRIPVEIDKIHELLKRYNLKPKKGITDNDLSLLIGRALKGVCTRDSSVQISKIAEEVDRVCIIARWDFAIGKYKSKGVDESNESIYVDVEPEFNDYTEH